MDHRTWVGKHVRTPHGVGTVTQSQRYAGLGVGLRVLTVDPCSGCPSSEWWPEDQVALIFTP
jgi:hypothetical protein